MFLYHDALSIPSMFPATVNREMKVLAQPVGIGCIVACALLAGVGFVELLRRRRKQAVWDFVFAVVALYCWTLAQSLTVPVK